MANPKSQPNRLGYAIGSGIFSGMMASMVGWVLNIDQPVLIVVLLLSVIGGAIMGYRSRS
ncbi:hypothetical protein [Herpetosiphon geysericola]|uniref:Uncharacterized protein n=1 Tax=Herpetosiphon geysericola TaxID=70996 RepID=A0A0P6Z3B0_9CHLR|nr:hypothetical protein [Herpetosiphon geysericola]KPL91887.1 hypothetical protein SE18_00575 [Herpetosiphon geysericola]